MTRPTSDRYIFVQSLGAEPLRAHGSTNLEHASSAARGILMGSPEPGNWVDIIDREREYVVCRYEVGADGITRKTK